MVIIKHFKTIKMDAWLIYWSGFIVSIIMARLVFGRSDDWSKVWKKVFMSFFSWVSVAIILIAWIALIIELAYRKVFTKKVRQKISKYLETPPRWL